jgi:hypothetical protein
MNARTTIVLLLVALGLYLFIRFFHVPPTREAAEREQYVAQIERDDIDAIVISGDGQKIELVKKNDEWRMQKPVSDRADSMTIDQLLGSVEVLRRENVIKLDDEKEQLKEYGLAKPPVRLKLRGKNAPTEFLFGADTAVEGKTYLRLDKREEIYVVSSDLKTQVSKTPDEFRDRSLTDLSVEQIDRVLIDKPSGQIEFHKLAEHWQMDKPLKARGDDSRINSQLAQTLKARIETFITDPKGLAQYGLAEPRGSIKFFGEEMEKPVELQIGAAVGEDKVYARLSNRDSVYVVPKQAAELLEANPNDLRDKHLVRLDLDIIDRITIKGAGEEIVFARDGEGWTLEGKEAANDAMIRQLVNALQNEQITRFVAESASDLEKYSLKQPQVQVRLSSFASENTAESEAGEQPVATLNFGKTEGEEIYARLEEEPYVIAVRKNLLHSIPLDPIQWRSLKIFDVEKSQIASLSREGQQPITLQRTKDRSWSAPSGELNQTNVQSLLNTLSSLRAARWIGATTKEHGFDSPALALSFKLNGKQERKLIVGNATPDGMRYAKIDKSDGTFVISQPDYSALQLPLSENQKAQPQTTPEVATEPVAAPQTAVEPQKPQQ